MGILTDWDPVLSQDLHIDRYKVARDRLHSDEWESGLNDLETLAHEGSLLSALLIADALREGRLYKQDLQMAEKWYSAAAESGSLRGCFGLGLTHLKLEQHDEAVRLLNLAAEAGYPPALNVLAGIYFRGNLSVRDRAKAEDFWNRAIDAGHVSAKVNYNFHKARGGYGVLRIPGGVVNYISAREEQERIKSISDEFDRLR